MKLDAFGICLLLFAAALVAWTGIFEPANTTTLKDWQPLMAAFIALIGGTLAYRGAMAKVNADSDRDQRELDRKKIGLYLRLLYPIEKMRVQSGDVRKVLTGYTVSARRFPPSAIRIGMLEEVEEAWKSLELFPVEVAVALDIIRTELPKAKRLLDTYPESDIIEIPSTGMRYSDALRPYADTCEKLEVATAKLIATLGQEVVRIRSLKSAATEAT
ncbi:hypothetical protein V1294_004370 [Bradyrhizobium sp. AZCC 1678]|uniref:hypothetical protein n=1 Tax=Bradyrhizobium sp. AZCC 1678 TaxID=3117030 RepID=UPI002FEF31D5